MLWRRFERYSPGLANQNLSHPIRFGAGLHPTHEALRGEQKRCDSFITDTKLVAAVGKFLKKPNEIWS